MEINNNRYSVRRAEDSEGLVVSIPKGEIMIDFLDFEETKRGVVYKDASGYGVPITAIIINSEEGSFSIQAVKKTKLANKLLKILAETDNYYLVRV